MINGLTHVYIYHKTSYEEIKSNVSLDVLIRYWSYNYISKTNNLHATFF